MRSPTHVRDRPSDARPGATVILPDRVAKGDLARPGSQGDPLRLPPSGGPSLHYSRRPSRIFG